MWSMEFAFDHGTILARGIDTSPEFDLKCAIKEPSERAHG